MSEPVPICIVTGQLGLGGGERQLYLVLRELDRELYRPAVITFNPGQDVPDSGTTAALLGLSFLGLIGVRRSSKKAR